MAKYVPFKEKLELLQEKYPNFSKEYLEEKASIIGSYSFFSIEFPMEKFNHGQFLKDLGVKEILQVTCEHCGVSFYKKDYKNIGTPLYRHQEWCKPLHGFINKYSWNYETLNSELALVGTVQDFIKKYPNSGGFAYKLFHMFNVDCSISRASKANDYRRRATNVVRYGSEHNFCKEHPSRKEWEQRLFEEEGITNVFQREEVKDKIIETCLDRYGVDSAAKSDQAKLAFKQTCLEKYGYTHHMKSPEFMEKFIQDRINKYGFYSAYDLYKNNNHGIVFSKPHKKVVELLLQNNIECKIEFILKIERDECIEGGNKTLYEYDILIGEKKLIEINGDYYHANPMKYKENDVLNIFGNEVIAKDIWNKDKIKLDFAKKKGYTIIDIWEYDIHNNWDKVSKEVLDYARNEDKIN